MLIYYLDLPGENLSNMSSYQLYLFYAEKVQHSLKHMIFLCLSGFRAKIGLPTLMIEDALSISLDKLLLIIEF